MSEGDWRGNKDMERERQGDEKNKEDRDTAAEDQSITLLFQPQKEKFRYVSVESRNQGHTRCFIYRNLFIWF